MSINMTAVLGFPWANKEKFLGKPQRFAQEMVLGKPLLRRYEADNTPFLIKKGVFPLPFLRSCTFSFLGPSSN
jgi:hypothetical protein